MKVKFKNDMKKKECQALVRFKNGTARKIIIHKKVNDIHVPDLISVRQMIIPAYANARFSHMNDGVAIYIQCKYPVVF